MTVDVTKGEGYREGPHAHSKFPVVECSFELLGYDFMVDADLQVWLLEVNSNPLMDGGTHVTQPLCDEALRAVLELVAGRESRLRTHWYRAQT